MSWHLTDGQRVLLKAHVHIAGGNGPILDNSVLGYTVPRHPWSFGEQVRVGEVLKGCYELIEQDRKTA